MRIYLVGFMGAGKTAVGERLAALREVPFVDLDAAVEAAAGRSVPAIFAAEGEAGFRRREAAALRATGRLERVVVATGGGILGDEDNRRWLAAHGRTVWLNPAFDTLLARLDAEARAARPLFHDEARARRLWQRRLAAYRGCDHELPVPAGEPPDETAARLARVLEEAACAT